MTGRMVGVGWMDGQAGWLVSREMMGWMLDGVYCWHAYFYTTYYRSGQEAHLTTVHFVYLPCCVADVTVRRDKRACEIFEA